jgi:hypothetical protein
MMQIEFHKPGPDKEPERPTRETPDSPVPPDMEPVVPQNDPPPGRPADGEPPPVIARRPG